MVHIISKVSDQQSLPSHLTHNRPFRRRVIPGNRRSSVLLLTTKLITTKRKYTRKPKQNINLWQTYPRFSFFSFLFLFIFSRQCCIKVTRTFSRSLLYFCFSHCVSFSLLLDGVWLSRNKGLLTYLLTHLLTYLRKRCNKTHTHTRTHQSLNQHVPSLLITGHVSVLMTVHNFST